jgi:hypothetical protein
MDFSKFFESIQESLGAGLPNLLGALVILVVGWLIAVIARAGVRKLLSVLGVNQRISSQAGEGVDVEAGTAKVVYWLILLLAVIAFFDALGLRLASEPLQALVSQFLGYAPKMIAGGVLLLVAWVLAAVVRKIAQEALAATSLDERLEAQAGGRPLSDTLPNVLYWLILLLFLPAILGAFEVRGLLEPVQGMLNKILGMLPNIIGAAVIGLVGWLVARIARDLVSNLLSAAGADRLGESVGMRGTMGLSQLVALVVYILILVPAIIAALNTLQLEAITAPATEMLSAILNALPNIFAAVVILAIAYLVSRLVATLAQQLLSGAGFDRLPERIGLAQAFQGDASPSRLVGVLIVFFVMLFASVEAAGRLGFSQVSDLVSMFIEFASQVLLGTVIIAVGFWLSNLAHAAITRIYGEGSSAVANVARFAILGIVLAMGLRAMGLADDIVNLAFGLTLGGVAFAFALAFGLGGREAAGRQMEHWLSRMRRE